MSGDPSAPPPSVPPAEAESLPSQLSAMNIGGKAEAPAFSSVGTSPLQSMFTQGGVMILQSVASGSTLCINDGEVSGKGIRDSYSQFVVHVRRPGMLSLQCVANPDWWLGIYEGRVLGSGGGGPYSEFNLKEVEDKYVALESAFYPGQHLGILDNGELKPPPETPALDRASLFISFPHATECPPATNMPSTTVNYSDDLPPPYPGPPQDRQSQGYGYPAAGVVMGAAAAVARQPTQPEMSYKLPPHGQPQGYQHPGGPAASSGPASPVNYVLSDLLNSQNILTFIPCIDISGRPIGVYHNVLGNPTIRSGGSYVGKDSEFMIETVGKGVVSLVNYCGRVGVIDDTKGVSVFKKADTQDDRLKFVIWSISGAILAFEPVKFPGHYLSMDRDGLIKLEPISLESQKVRFTVRVSKFNAPYTQVIMSPFGDVPHPSIISKLKDRSVIQLYDKPTMTFLCLIEGGNVAGVPTEEIGTCLIYCDRGVGRVSLKSYHRDLLKLRMSFNGKQTSVGPEDVNGDFYIKETRNGTIMFESVAFPGKYVYMFHGKGKRRKQLQEFSVFLMDIKKSIGFGANKTIPKYSLD